MFTVNAGPIKRINSLRSGSELLLRELIPLISPAFTVNTFSLEINGTEQPRCLCRTNLGFLCLIYALVSYHLVVWPGTCTAVCDEKRSPVQCYTDKF